MGRDQMETMEQERDTGLQERLAVVEAHEGHADEVQSMATSQMKRARKALDESSDRSDQEPTLSETDRRRRAEALMEESLQAKTGAKQLDRGDLLRHKRSYDVLYDLAQKTEGLNIIVIGLGRLEEPLGYIAAYQSARGNCDGLDCTLVDIRPPEAFTDILAADETYELGRSFTGQPRIPTRSISGGFSSSDDGIYSAIADVRGKLQSDLGNNAHFLTSVSERDELEEAGLLDSERMFVSCNNVLQYIDDDQRESAIDSLVSITAEGGVLSIQTDDLDPAIDRLLQQRYPGVFTRLKKGIYKKSENTQM